MSLLSFSQSFRLTLLRANRRSQINLFTREKVSKLALKTLFVEASSVVCLVKHSLYAETHKYANELPHSIFIFIVHLFSQNLLFSAPFFLQHTEQKSSILFFKTIVKPFALWIQNVSSTSLTCNSVELLGTEVAKWNESKRVSLSDSEWSQTFRKGNEYLSSNETLKAQFLESSPRANSKRHSFSLRVHDRKCIGC